MILRKKINYFEFFKASDLRRVDKFSSTKEVVDSIFDYQQLVERIWKSNPRNNNYWFVTNLLDLTLRHHQFYKTVLYHGRYLKTAHVYTILRDFKQDILREIPKEEQQSIHIIRDTLNWIHACLTYCNKVCPLFTIDKQDLD